MSRDRENKGRSVKERRRNTRRRQIRKYRMMGIKDSHDLTFGLPAHEVFLVSPHLGEAYMRGHRDYEGWRKRGWLLFYSWRLEYVARWVMQGGEPVIQEARRVKNNDLHDAWVYRVARNSKETNTPWSKPVNAVWIAVEKLEEQHGKYKNGRR